MCSYFNYIRTSGGSTPHKTMRECLQIARGRQTATVLSSTANNGERGGRKRSKRFDEACAELPLHSSRTGGSSKIDLVAQQKKKEQELTIASIW